MMPASSKLTGKNWHPSRLLAYNALPGHQDFDSTTFDAKSTAETRTDFFDRSLTSRRYALVGVTCSSIFSCICIIAGSVTLANYGISGVTPLSIVEYHDVMIMYLRPMELSVRGEILTLILDLIVTLCTESIGFIHGISLRSALASESRLRFNTNLRLLTAARGWYNPNGALLNGISAVLLTISYSSASLIICQDYQVTLAGGSFESISIAGFPLLILGIALLLQVMIALLAMWAVKILTWSSSPFDLTAALVHHTQLTPSTLRCMRHVSDLDTYGGPAKPTETQPSALHAHPSIRKVVISLWVMVAACAVWGALVMYIWGHFPTNKTFSPSPLTLQMWSFLGSGLSNSIAYFMPSIGLKGWVLLLVNIAVLIVNVIRDERRWRCATKREGLRVATNPLKPIFAHPICLILFIAKPFLHWMFGLSFSLALTAFDENITALLVTMYTAQIWNLCIALFIFSSFFTFIALRRPCGPQPAAYGHLQTLANLVDEWSPVMWWGHKEDGIPYCHAGTSDHPLPDVKMDCVYAGSGAGSAGPFS
ncbi:uncharacterized protein EDB93DRAFT_1117952 [Suillus bovinus]|uniref:uncharacterized protein n=1 Tax=Suillus bovinus TaxID=48563 RepID=UPI001B883119|nr:uncharacterized protein EDB93DRAFT_1117952 [Suillus bovinus]KAG2159079.1 hypothetical protein EDB93DRAFT_1117952 [Suillus bovinus]